MDQIILLIAGTVGAVFYIFSPVKLSDWLLDRLEKLGATAGISGKVQKVRSYYVRGSHK